MINPTAINHPLVTIVALSYNHGDYVLETLESIQNQIHQNIQLIIIDNGSKDDSVEKINQWIDKSAFSNVQFFPEVNNLGVCAALNKALKLSKGEYFQFISCDDILLSHKIEKQIGVFEDLPETVAFIYGNFKYINEKSEILDQPTHFAKQGWVHQSDLPCGRVKLVAINNYFIAAPTVLYRTSCLKEIGGYDENIPFEDFQMNLRLLSKFSCYGLFDDLCFYRVLSDSFYNSTSEHRIEKNYLQTMKYVYGDSYYQNWVILLRYILFNDSPKFKIIKKTIFSLLNIAATSMKKDYGIKL